MANIDGILNGVDLFGNPINNRPTTPLAQRFGFPPFTILDGRGGDWLDRKRAWLSIGITSEVGRSAKAYNIHGWMEDRPEARGEIGIEGLKGDGTSIFDPVLCEMAYKWFTREGSQVVDPFAGGSVRGIVAGCMSRNYWGCDLRSEQVEANIAQRDLLMPVTDPVWVCGDSLDTLKDAPDADFIFSCPPYGDLEVYSDNERDLSNMEWNTFTAAYGRIIIRACERLKNNRFACFVVGDFRDKDGNYRDFVSQTIRAFTACGMKLYNEAILVTPVGTAAMRVTKQFDVSRKMAKVHQNVLVFVKGDARVATAHCNG
jgi:hypothetical protein